MFKYEFKFEQNRKGSWIWVKVTSLNRLDFYMFLGTGINSFGKIFNFVELFENPQKRKMKKGPVRLGQNGHSATGPGRTAHRTGASARARVFKPDGRGPAVSGCEGRERAVRMTGGARLSSSTTRPKRRRAHRRRFRARRGKRRA